MPHSSERDNVFSWARNPYSLAEHIVGKRIPWSRLADSGRILERILGFPASRLGEINDDSPLYWGARLDDAGQIQRLRREDHFDVGPTGMRTLHRVPDWVRQLGEPAILRVADICFAPSTSATGTATWRDAGTYVTDAVEFLDPTQGSLGDCFFIAALGAVAYARPSVIRRRGETDGTHRIKFHARLGWETRSPDENVPWDVSRGCPLYASSEDAGEAWPCVYEKGYAMFKSDTTSQRPDYQSIDGGDAEQAMHDITGYETDSWNTAFNDYKDLYQIVLRNCRNGRTFNPMTASTFSSALDPRKPEYAGTGLYARHAYTVLGCHKYDGARYIVLRNPWGRGEAYVDTHPGKFDGCNLGENGVFALRARTFEKYFRKIAVAMPEN